MCKRVVLVFRIVIFSLLFLGCSPSKMTEEQVLRVLKEDLVLKFSDPYDILESKNLHSSVVDYSILIRVSKADLKNSEVRLQGEEFEKEALEDSNKIRYLTETEPRPGTLHSKGNKIIRQCV